MTKALGTFLMLVGAAASVTAAVVPEIDPSSGASALALLAGSLLVIRGRRK